MSRNNVGQAYDHVWSNVSGGPWRDTRDALFQWSTCSELMLGVKREIKSDPDVNGSLSFGHLKTAARASPRSVRGEVRGLGFLYDGSSRITNY